MLKLNCHFDVEQVGRCFKKKRNYLGVTLALKYRVRTMHTCVLTCYLLGKNGNCCLLRIFHGRCLIMGSEGLKFKMVKGEWNLENILITVF